MRIQALITRIGKYRTSHPRVFVAGAFAPIVLVALTVYWSDVARFLGIERASAATYQMQTGYFVGNGGTKEISGLGFAPDLVILKADSNAGTGAVFKTSSMPQNTTAFLGTATADATALITFTDDGFIVSGANANTNAARHTWIAFTGSDCTSGGQFCVGAYTGTGAPTRSVSTGFQPNLVWVKNTTATTSNWRSSSMPDNTAQFFAATAQNTAGNYFTTLDSSGFTVGITNNTNTVSHHFVAFKEVSGVIDVGTYTGDTSDNRSITGIGFRPDFVFTKNASVASSAVSNLNESYGDSSSLFTDAANTVNAIQALESDGFQVGTSSTANGNTNTHYYAAFDGASAPSASGSFLMAQGTYTGNGSSQTIENLPFAPDLVIVKASTTQAGVFSTRVMGADTTAYLDAATADFTGGITTLGSDGFSVGTNATVNSNGVTYFWSAYGNAWSPETRSGASDFVIGAYYGNGRDSRDITRLPFAPDHVSVKRSGATGGTWRTSEHVGDLSSFYAATAEGANNIQALNTDGFEVGTAANVNTDTNLHWYFAFATGTNMSVGTYAGNGTSQSVGTGFAPDHVWVKSAGATRGVLRTSNFTGSTSAPFINVAPIAGAVDAFTAGGFSVGGATEANTNGTNYRFSAWNTTSVVGSSTYRMRTGYYIGDGGAQTITFGFSPDLVILKADTNAGTGALFKTSAMGPNVTGYLGTATADDATGQITLTPEGFRVLGVNSNTASTRYTWIAFDGADCSASGYLCVGRYTGNGGTRSFTTGFAPSLAVVKSAAATTSTWRSSSMPVNSVQSFAATAGSTGGNYFTTLDASGFSVGTNNNTNATVHHFFAFRERAGWIDVGSYVGNLTVDRSITGVGFQPAWILTKYATGTVGAVYNQVESHGDYSSYFTDTGNLTDAIQILETDGFQVGGSNTAHASGVTYYYFAFGNASTTPGTGTFTVQSGSYTGSGDARAITGVGFAPDLVIVKGNTGQPGVFTSRVMPGDSTAYLDSAVANFTGGITALGNDGFAIGTNATVNTSGVTYYWTAFGNAWNPQVQSGAADFVIGAYTGNGLDSRNIIGQPFAPDMVTLKRNGASGAAWRGTAHVGDVSSLFDASNEAANVVQALNTDGFQVGNAANSNTGANVYYYFSFATSSTFAVGTYNGNGASQDVSIGFQPQHLWVKRTTATQGVMRLASLTGDGVLPFINNALVSGAITGLTGTGFSVGSAAETNANGVNNYRYAAWKRSVLHQIHYHFRNDDGDESDATSATLGTQDTPLSSVRENIPYRLRLAVSNEGGVVASSTGFRLEWAEKGASCASAATWERVGATGGAWDLYDSANLTNGNNTTNIAGGIGGVTDENTAFLSPNGGVRDTSDETGVLTIDGDEFVDLEYAVTPTQYATDTTAYCFRVTAQGEPISDYIVYPEATFEVHLIATTTGSQLAEATIPSTDLHVGGAFVLSDEGAGDPHTVTDITVSEVGTVNGQTGLDNIRVRYEYDTSAPYDCASESYDGSELPFGVSDTDGFSGPNGSSTFAGSVTASSTQAVCLYPVVDVTTSALSGETVDLEISATSDIVLSGGERARLAAVPLSLSGSTTLAAPLLTQTHYHFRNDNGSESGATSATGGSEDTVLENVSKGSPKRLRLQVSNEGLATSSATAFRLEYAERSGGSCSATASGWTDVGAALGAWDMSNSGNLTDGTDTTNIAEGLGGVTDENTSFLSPNGGVRDTSSETGGLTLSPSEFVELEYSIVALSGAVDGASYCFRVTAAGTALPVYDTWGETTIAADALVSTLGAHKDAVRASSTNEYLGGAWVISDLGSVRNVTSVTLTERGSIDAQADLSNIRLYYESDTSNPYTCESESYDGTEAQYGATSSAFTAANGTTTFSGSVGISTISTLCLYAVLDIDPTASSGDTILLSIEDPGTEVGVSSGTVNPNSPVAPTGSTTVQKPRLTQTGYHFRNDDGSESGATSATAGVENTALPSVQAGVVQRLRLAVSNEGSTSSALSIYTLEYAERVSTCAAASGWTRVGAPGAHMSVSESDNLTGGDDTTNIATSTGGVSNPNTSFVSPNSGVVERAATTTSYALDEDEYVELEFVFEPNTDAQAGTTYCFRVVDTFGPLPGYDAYPELTMRTNQDFRIQRGVTDITNGNTTASITAGSNYTAPAASTSAFIRITNAAYTGAGPTSGGGTQNANIVTASIQNPSDIMTSVTFVRSGNTNNTRIYWEIVEYVGPPGGDNEIKVRAQERVTYGAANTTVTTPTASGVVTDSDMVVFITGQQNPSAASTAYQSGISTAAWNSGSDDATFTRGATGTAAVVSYALVEFTGPNWRIQRSEHTYGNAGAVENESITPVNDRSRAFLHAQKRVGVNQVDEFGHLVELSTVDQVSYQVPATAASIGTHVSVAWVIENTQTNGSPMVVHRSGGTQNAGGVEPSTYAISIGGTLSSTANASLFMNMWGLGNNTQHPQAIMGAGITSTTFYELWISDTGSGRSYRTEVVDWPTAVRTLEQNYYRIYTNNDALDPTDAWPLGGTDLGDNTALTSLDEPPTDGDVLRLRMTVKVRGASLSQGTEAFKLQYGVRPGLSCSAVSAWQDLGDIGSSTAAWRGYDATPLDGSALSTNPPTVGDLNIISVADRAGTYEEQNPSTANPYRVQIGEDVEYDWVVEANAILDKTVYCFRMTLEDGTPFDEYTYHPTITTAGFEVEQKAWRFYGDETSLTPGSALAATNTAPTGINPGDPFKLRVLVEELAGKSGQNVKFRLQYSESSTFTTFEEVSSADTCSSGSRWCFADGAGSEGATVTAAVLYGADSCVAGVGEGCGTHNEYPYTPEVVGEVGTSSVAAAGTVISLAHTYTDPVFIVEAISGDASGGAGNRPAAAIITATSTSSFTVKVQEPDDEADTHAAETVAYLVMERGAYTLPDGRRVDVGTQSVSDYYGNAVAGASDATCSFTQTFSQAPVVLTALQSNVNTSTPDFLTASQRSITTDDFACALEVPDGVTSAPGSAETYGWIAIEQGTFSNNGIALLATTTGSVITGWGDTPWYDYTWPVEYFASAPGLVASKQTRNGAEGGWVRYDNEDADSVQLAIDEADGGNRLHAAEQLGLFAFSRAGTLYRAGTSPFTFDAQTVKEFEFTLVSKDAYAGRTYFFRLYDVANDAPVTASTTLSGYPSLVAASGAITFSILGVDAGSTTEGVVTDVATTPTTVPFGRLVLGTDRNAAQRLTVTTNASLGYQVYLYERQDLTAGVGATIQDIAGTNLSPVPWASGCLVSAKSCYGYHAGDNTLSGGSTRFLINDTFAALTSTSSEVAHSSVPVTAQSTDIVYRIRANASQEAGTYSSKLVYIVVPTF